MEDRMTAQQLKNSILQMAVQGKLVPQDPNDEPASVLLDRIRKEKEQLIKDGKIKKNKKESYIFRGADNLHYEQIGKEVKCIEDELPFEIPNDWEYARLGTLLLKLTDGTHSTPKYIESGIPFVSVKDISSRYLDLTDTKYISIEEHNELYKRCDPQKGDILLSKVGTTGIPVLVDTDNIFSLFVSVALLKFNHADINPFFLIYLLSSPLVQNQCKENTKGVGNKNWVMRDIANTLVVIPPYNEQQRIVDKINELEPLIDKYKLIEEKLYKLNSSIKEQLKKSILQYAIEGNLVQQDPNDEPAFVLLERIREEKNKLVAEGKIKKDKNESIIYRRDNSYYEKCGSKILCIDEEIPFYIPDNWEWARLGNIGEWKAGATPSKSNMEYYKNGSIPWLLTGDLNDGIIQEIPNKITEKALNETSVKLNPSGSVLIAMYGATIGKLGILSFPATTNQACCACNVFQPFYNLYLFYFLMANKIHFVKQGEGGAQPNISREKIVKTLIPVPPINEQKRIINKIKKLKVLL